MTLHRILPACLLLLTAFGTTGSAWANNYGPLNGLVARLQGQANVAKAEVRGGFRRSNHYYDLIQVSDSLAIQVEELQANLRMGAPPAELRQNAVQANQLVGQFDGLVEHVEGEIQSGACTLPVNPQVLHRRVHQMQGMTQEVLAMLPAPVVALRPNFNSGFGQTPHCDNGSNGYGGNGVNPQPYDGSYGYGNGYGVTPRQPISFGNGGYGSGYRGGYGVNPQPGFTIGANNGGLYIGGRSWGFQFGR